MSEGAMREWVGLALRLVVGGVWLVAGALKLPDPAESVRAVRAYQLLPEAVVPTVGHVLPVLEVALGLLLLLGLLTRAAAAVSALLLLAFVGGIAWAWSQGLQIECGCFGGGGASETAADDYPWEIARDAALAAASAYLLWRPVSRLALDSLLFPVPERHHRGARTHVRPRQPSGPPPYARPRPPRSAAGTCSSPAPWSRSSCWCSWASLVQAGRDTTGDRAVDPAGATDAYGVVVGDPDAPTSLVVYEDFQCPICAVFEDATSEQLAEAIDAGEVSVEYRIVSFLDRASRNDYSSRAANAAAAVLDTAGAHAFRAFHERLFADQPAEGTAGPDDDALVALAEEAGADTDAVRAAVEEGEFDQWVVNATDAMSQAGVTGTPTVLIDGELAGETPQEAIGAVLAETGAD